MLSRVEEVITGVLFMYCETLLAAFCTSSKSTSISLEAILYNLNWEIKILRVYLKVKTWEVFLCFLAIIFLGPVVLTSQWRLSWVSQVFTPRMSKNWLEFLYAIVGHQYQPSLHSGIRMAIRLFTVPEHSLKFPMKAKDPRNANQLERQPTRTPTNQNRQEQETNLWPPSAISFLSCQRLLAWCNSKWPDSPSWWWSKITT